MPQNPYRDKSQPIEAIRIQSLGTISYHTKSAHPVRLPPRGMEVPPTSMPRFFFLGWLDHTLIPCSMWARTTHDAQLSD